MPQPIRELLEKRSRWGRHYENDDGSFSVKVENGACFQRGGEWLPSEDFHITESAGVYSGTADGWTLTLDGLTLAITTPQGSIPFTLAGMYVDNKRVETPTLATPVVDGNTVTLPDVFTNVDWRITFDPGFCRQEIVVRAHPCPTESGTDWYIGWETPANVNLAARQLGTATVQMYLRSFSALSADAIHEVQTAKTGGVLKKGIPLGDLGTLTYPLVLDPTTSPNPSSDAYISNIYENYSRFDTTSLYVYTYTDEEERYRAYMRFDLSEMGSYTINSATMNVYPTANAGTPNLKQSVGEIDPEGGAAGTVWSYANGTNIGTIPSGTGAYKSVTCTTYVDTHKGGYCDFGIVNDSEQYAFSCYSSESSSNKPYLYIDYSSGSTDATCTLSSGSAVANGTSTTVTGQQNATCTLTAGQAVAGGTEVTVTAVMSPTVQLTGGQAVAQGTQVDGNGIRAPTCVLGAGPATGAGTTVAATASTSATLSAGQALASGTSVSADGNHAPSAPVLLYPWAA